jgi:hypothetical protein
MEGPLIKWINIIEGWRYRYFLLKEEKLLYFDKKGGILKGSFNVKELIIKKEDEYKIRLEYENNKVSIKAESQFIRDQWYKALTDVKLTKTENNSNIKSVMNDIKLNVSDISSYHPLSHRDSTMLNSTVLNKGFQQETLISYFQNQLNELNSKIEGLNKYNTLLNFHISNSANNYNYIPVSEIKHIYMGNKVIIYLSGRKN